MACVFLCLHECRGSINKYLSIFCKNESLSVSLFFCLCLFFMTTFTLSLIEQKVYLKYDSTFYSQCLLLRLVLYLFPLPSLFCSLSLTLSLTSFLFLFLLSLLFLFLLLFLFFIRVAPEEVFFFASYSVSRLRCSR